MTSWIRTDLQCIATDPRSLGPVAPLSWVIALACQFMCLCWGDSSSLQLSHKPAGCFGGSLAPLSCHFRSGIMAIVAQLARRKSETCALGGWGWSSLRWLWSSLWCGRSQQSELLGQRDSLSGGRPLISVTSKQVFLLSQFPILSSFYSLYHSPHLLPAVSHQLSQDSHTVATMTSQLMDVSETFLSDVHIMLICHFSRCLSHSLFFPDSLSHTHTHIKNLLLSFLSESSFDIYLLLFLILREFIWDV